MGLEYTETALTTKKEWRSTPRAADSRRGGRLAKGNGTTDYGELQAGTILAEDGSGDLHPLGVAKVAVAPSASNDVEIDNAANFYVGDVVSLRSGSNVAKAITINSVAVTIKAKLQGLSLVVAVAGNSTAQKCVYNPVNKTITFTSATDGGGAATSTHADLVSELLKFGQLIESASSATPATLCAALSSTALGNAKYGAIASARTITGIAGNVLTLSGGTFTAAIDDIVAKDTAYVPAGILDETVSTVRYKGTTKIAADKSVTVAYEGDTYDSKTFLPNLCAGNAGAFVKSVLGGHLTDDLADPSLAAPTTLVPKVVGFRFLSLP